jgi:hypothetical protein
VLLGGASHTFLKMYLLLAILTCFSPLCTLDGKVLPMIHMSFMMQWLGLLIDFQHHLKVCSSKMMQ